MKLLGAIHRRQARIFAKLQRAILREVDRRYKENKDWEMPEETRVRLAEINRFLGETSTSMVRVNDAAIKASQALTNEQLNAQLRAEFVRAAWSFTAEEWATLDEVRAKRAREPETTNG